MLCPSREGVRALPQPALRQEISHVSVIGSNAKNAGGEWNPFMHECRSAGWKLGFEWLGRWGRGREVSDGEFGGAPHCGVTSVRLTEVRSRVMGGLESKT